MSQHKKRSVEILKKLKKLGTRRNVEGMARFGINPQKAYGVSKPKLRETARKIGKSHPLALRLWATGNHDARILASMIDDPAKVTGTQMDRWANVFDSWDLCDQCCGNLFENTKYAYSKCTEWSKAEKEFVKRAGFALMARLAVSDKSEGDAAFKKFLPIIKRESDDERNFVKKAANWALRQIGKRNTTLNKSAIKAARQILEINSKSARWIANDAIRELTSSAVKKRLSKLL